MEQKIACHSARRRGMSTIPEQRRQRHQPHERQRWSAFVLRIPRYERRDAHQRPEPCGGRHASRGQERRQRAHIVADDDRRSVEGRGCGRYARGAPVQGIARRLGACLGLVRVERPARPAALRKRPGRLVPCPASRPQSRQQKERGGKLLALGERDLRGLRRQPLLHGRWGSTPEKKKGPEGPFFEVCRRRDRLGG